MKWNLRNPRVLSLSVVAVLLALVVPSAASAATGSYRIDNWSQPLTTHANLWDRGALITPPAGVPANATITRIFAYISFHTSPAWNSDYEARFCDYDTSICKMSIYDSEGGAGWPAITDEFAGEPAATFRFNIDVRENNHQGGTIYPVLNPYRIPANNRWVQVNYEYTP